MSEEHKKYLWIEYTPKNPEELCEGEPVGLHGSGYRYLALRGARRDESGLVVFDVLHQWADHIIFYCPVNIDVTKEGVHRVMPWGGFDLTVRTGWFGSTAEVNTSDLRVAVTMIEAMGEARS